MCYVPHAINVASLVLPTLKGAQKRQVQKLLDAAVAADSAVTAIPSRHMHSDNPEAVEAIARQEAAGAALWQVVNLIPIPADA